MQLGKLKRITYRALLNNRMTAIAIRIAPRMFITRRCVRSVDSSWRKSRAMDLNSLMSVAEFGVVVGVLMEGAEYVPWIHNRWPIIERLGFLILVVSLVADWHFQSAINERQTQALIAPDHRYDCLTKAPNPV